MTQEWNIAHSRQSSFREAVVEHLFVGELLRVLWLRGPVHAEVLRPQVDDAGYDLVVEANSVARHIQLKASFRGATTARQKVNQRLAGKPSGCVVWVEFDDQDMSLGPFHWFGAAPGCPLPDLSHFRNAKHTRGNATGVKAERPEIREVPKGRFSRMDRMEEVADALFWGEERRRDALSRAAGMWKGRTDLPDFEALRSSWNRV